MSTPPSAPTFSTPSPALPRLDRAALLDASLRRVVLDHRTRQVIFFLRTADGEALELLYHRVDLAALDAGALEDLKRGAVIVDEELEALEEGYRHRLELDPGGEVEVVFRDAATG